MCNGCYGRLLSLFEIKAGTTSDDERADQLADALLSAVASADQREAERLFRIADNRAALLSPGALRFIATSEHVAQQLQDEPQLEWSPAVIGLCKAVEAEVVHRILLPLADAAKTHDLAQDKADKDLGKVATFCLDTNRKPPELGTFAHFLQTAIHSQHRRDSSQLLRCLLSMAGEWTGSHWLLDPQGCHNSLVLLTTKFRNRAAHIDELGRDDYLGCRELTIGSSGILWELCQATERQHKVAQPVLTRPLGRR